MTFVGRPEMRRNGAILHEREWHPVCPIERVPLDRGVAVLLGESPVAVFRLSPLGDQESEILAVGHVDPTTGSPVIARGLVGSSGPPPRCLPTVASPLFKERYNLRTGACLDDPGLSLPTYEVRVIEDIIELAAAIRPR